jgi:hypothetical protein
MNALSRNSEGLPPSFVIAQKMRRVFAFSFYRFCHN